MASLHELVIFPATPNCLVCFHFRVSQIPGIALSWEFSSGRFLFGGIFSGKSHGTHSGMICLLRVSFVAPFGLLLDLLLLCNEYVWMWPSRGRIILLACKFTLTMDF